MFFVWYLIVGIDTLKNGINLYQYLVDTFNLFTTACLKYKTLHVIVIGSHVSYVRLRSDGKLIVIYR